MTLYLHRRTLVIALLVGWLAGEPEASLGQRFSLDLPTATQANPLQPDEALESFVVHPDFRIELVACEPWVQDPVAMQFDERGDLYVVEYPEFNHYQLAAGSQRSGRVKRLRDVDGDGVFDQASVFLEVPFATGLCCYDGGLFVAAPPDMLYCKDFDDDGVADEKKVVLTGFGKDFAGGGLVNSLRWGLDFRIHIATGFAGGRVHPPQSTGFQAIDIQGRGLLLNPRKMHWEATSGGGQHGMSIDDWGNKFLCSNVYPLQMLFYDDREILRNPYFSPPAAAQDIHAEDPLAVLGRISPLEPWRVVRSRGVVESPQPSESARSGGVFTSASGIFVYRGDAFPESFVGNLFVGEVANNLVYRALLESKGHVKIAKRADKKMEFLASRDSWFRPVQFSGGPDGALYVVDMYRQLIEGAAFVPRDELSKMDVSLGTDCGRIYRVLPRRAIRKEATFLTGLTSKELVAFLDHANGWHRDTAARLLYQRNAPETIPPLRSLFTHADHARSRLLALYALQAHGVQDEELILQALRDPHPEVRRHAVRIAVACPTVPTSWRETIFQRSEDPDPRVRYQVAFALGRFGGTRRNARLSTLASRDVDNPWMLAAIQSALRHGAGEVCSQLMEDPRTGKDTAVQEFLLNLAKQVGRQQDAGQVAAVLKSIDAVDPSEFSSRFQRTMLAGLQPVAKDPHRLSEMFSALLEEAQRHAVDSNVTETKRLEAIRILASADFSESKVQQIFRALLRNVEVAGIQRAALQALARMDHPQVSDLILQRWPQMTPEIRRAALEVFLSRESHVVKFLDAVQHKQLRRDDLDSARFHMLKSQFTVETREWIDRLFSETDRRDRSVLSASYQAGLKNEGDIQRGQQIFQQVCSACHQHGSVGKAVGPRLDNVDHHSTSSLLSDILDPNRKLKPLYQNYVVETKSGRIVSGMILEETANGIRLQQSSGELIELLRIEIEELRSTGVSFMPEGLEKKVDLQAMADLLTFLRSSPR